MTLVNSLSIFILFTALGAAQHASKITATLIIPGQASNLVDSGLELLGRVQRWAQTDEADALLKGEHHLSMEIVPIRTSPDWAFILVIRREKQTEPRRFVIETRKGVQDALAKTREAIRVFLKTPPPVSREQSRKLASAPAAAPTPLGSAGGICFSA